MSKFKIVMGNWVDYWADGSLDEPDNRRQAQVWSKTSSGSPVIGVIASTSGSTPNAQSLKIDTSEVTGTNETAFYGHNSGTAPWAQNVDKDQGYTIEAQVKVVDAKSEGGQLIYWEDGNNKEYLLFDPAFVKLGFDGTTYAFTATGFNKYRVTVKSTEVKVYVNDTLRITGTMGQAGTAHTKRIFFGDFFSTFGGECRYAYMRYSTEDALKPTEDWNFATIDLQDRRRVRANTVIRSSNSIIPDGKMNPARLRLAGTISGSNYDNFRNNVRRLKKLLDAGTQRVHLDDERFIDALHSAFRLRTITQDYASFDIGMQARSPFFQEQWASYFSTAPAANGTFYVVNNSDIEIPIKVVITGAAATTIDNDIRLKNITADQDAKYTGVLAPTQELIIDKGFDNYNEFAVTVGSNAHLAFPASFGSFEGDLFTLKPGENIFVPIGLAAGTIEIYWREAFLQ